MGLLIFCATGMVGQSVLRECLEAPDVGCVSAVGMNEADYTRITHDLTLGVARTLVAAYPNRVFVSVTGAGTDSSEKSKTMWARVKGRTENALLQQGFRGLYLFRPGVIQPLNAVASKTRIYRAAYVVAQPLFGLMRAFWPQSIFTSAEVGQAMLTVARSGYPRPILEVRDIQVAARKPPESRLKPAQTAPETPTAPG